MMVGCGGGFSKGSWKELEGGAVKFMVDGEWMHDRT